MMRGLFALLALGLGSIPMAFAEPVSVSENRVLGFQGAPNFRDIGGYATKDGRHVRWGRVYRSDKLSALTPEDDTKLDGMHLVAEIDLRTREERESEPSRWLHRPADIYESPKASLGPDIKSLLAEVHDAASARTAVENFYAHMPDLYREEYAAFFRRLLAGEEPLVVHCTAGKDRTGVASAILLSALEVPRSTVVADYTLTEKLVPAPPSRTTDPAQSGKASPALSAMDRLPDDARVELWRSEDQYVLAALTAIDHEYGSVDGYLKTGLGLSDDEIARLRATLTQ